MLRTSSPKTAHFLLSHSLYALLTLTLLSPSIEAATWYLKSGGTGSGNSWENASGYIQNTIKTATDGDEIWIAEGTYIEAITITANIALYGGFTGTETTREQRDRLTHPTILNSEGISSTVITVSGEITVLDGLKVTGGSKGVDYSYVSSS
jgi:hypothetical protein